MQEVINPNEFKKLLIEESTSWTTTTTFIWTTEYKRPEYAWGYSSSADTARPIWRIKKIEADSSTWITEVSYPDGSYWFNFAWDNKDSLTYK